MWLRNLKYKVSELFLSLSDVVENSMADIAFYRTSSTPRWRANPFVWRRQHLDGAQIRLCDVVNSSMARKSVCVTSSKPRWHANPFAWRRQNLDGTQIHLHDVVKTSMARKSVCMTSSTPRWRAIQLFYTSTSNDKHLLIDLNKIINSSLCMC